MTRRRRSARTLAVAGVGLVGLARVATGCGDPTYEESHLVTVEAGVPDASNDALVAPRDTAVDDGGHDDEQETSVGDRGTLVAAGEVAVADTTCAARGGTFAALGPDPGADAGDADGGPAALDPVVGTFLVGARRALALAGSEGALLVDADGQNLSTTTLVAGTSGAVVASEGTNLGVAAANGTSEVVYARFDATGQAVGAPMTVTGSELRTNVALGAGGGHALVVWTTETAVRARGVDDGVLGTTAFDLASPAATSFFLASAAFDGADGFGVAYSAAGSAGAYAMTFVHAKSAGPDPGGAVLLLESARPIGLAALARTSAGYALLFNAPGPAVDLVLLDAGGHPTTPVQRLEGASTGWALAVNGGELGVVAGRASGEVEFRPFSAADAHALGSWVCLDAASQDPDERATVDADGAGYAVVYRRPSRGEALVRFDHLGTGP